MQSQVRRADYASTLGAVFAITLAILVMACGFVLMGVAGLLGLDGVSVEPVPPVVGRPF
jgi:hypothetical protein